MRTTLLRGALVVIVVSTAFLAFQSADFLRYRILWRPIGYAWTDGPGPRYRPHYRVHEKRWETVPGESYVLVPVPEENYYHFHRRLYWFLRVDGRGGAQMQSVANAKPSRASVKIPPPSER